MKRRGIVNIDGVRYDRDQVKKSPGDFSAALQVAHTDGKNGICDCSRPGSPLRIKLCCSKLGRFYFSLWAEEGDKHGRLCAFRRDAVSLAEADAARLSAIREEEDGDLNIKPAFALVRRLNAPRAAPSNSSDSKPRVNRAEASLLYMLRYLWKRAELTRWHAGWRRTYSDVVWRLWDEIKDLHFGKQPAGPLIHIPPQYDEAKQAELEGRRKHWLRTLRPAPGTPEIKSGLVIGAIRQAFDEGDRSVILLSQTNLALELTHAQSNRLVNSYRSEAAFLSSADKRDAWVFVIAQVEDMERADRVRVVDAALMLVSKRFIPVDSSYELKLANYLTEEGRTFVKPVILAKDAPMLPDFVLQDQPEDLHMEVFGMSTPEYLVRKAEKIEEYRRRGLSLWLWDAASREPMPAVPPVWRG